MVFGETENQKSNISVNATVQTAEFGKEYL
jgi:hypothetical protein